jgi:GNAT superfamily N-acetyltransferase
VSANQMSVQLRPGLAEDAEAIAHVLISSRLAYMPFAPSVHPPEDVRAWVGSHLIPCCRTTVAIVDGTIVGVLATAQADGVSWIRQLFVLPGWVGRGIGSQLLRHAHAELPRPIRLYTFQAHVLARRFYERHGYRAIELTDGKDNEERCPDVLYELSASASAA